jgi:hypothetical protein
MPDGRRTTAERWRPDLIEGLVQNDGMTLRIKLDVERGVVYGMGKELGRGPAAARANLDLHAHTPTVRALKFASARHFDALVALRPHDVADERVAQLVVGDR